jgi:hypothetical protein
MRLSAISLTTLVAFPVAIFLMFQSCGKGSGTKSDAQSELPSNETVPEEEKETESSKKVVDPTTIASVSLSNGTVATIPAGVIPVGGSLTLEITTAAVDLSSLAITSASDPLKFSAKDADGIAINELTQAGTLAISISNGAALQDVEKTQANLCALAVTPAGAKLIWRRPSFTEVTETTAKFLTKYMGTFQLVYCGSTVLTGFSEVGIDGSISTNPADTQTTSNDQSSLTGISCHIELNKMCTLIVGKDYDFDPLTCVNVLQSVVGTSCSAVNVIGICAIDKGTTKETAYVYYQGSEETAATCQSQGGQFFTEKTYVPTPATVQTPPPAAKICGRSIAPACVSNTANEACTMYTGSSWATDASASVAECTSSGNTWQDSAEEGCSASGVIDCCIMDDGEPTETVIVRYNNDGQSCGGLLVDANGDTKVVPK